jgi:ribosomal protein S18 acetylase RimI-like enzyme
MISIVPYTDETKDWIRLLNYEWLEKFFRVEPNDVIQLSDPQGEIIDKGGQIFYALYNGHIAGTSSLMKAGDDVYELAKMAVTDAYKGKGIGNALIEFCIAKAKEAGAAKLILYSNTKLTAAINLYRKYGFQEIPMGDSHYERSDIKMEKIL